MIDEKELEKEKEVMQAVNTEITGALKELSEKHGLRIAVIAYHDEVDQMGIWKSENVTQLHEMAFSKVMGSQF